MVRTSQLPICSDRNARKPKPWAAGRGVSDGRDERYHGYDLFGKRRLEYVLAYEVGGEKLAIVSKFGPGIIFFLARVDFFATH